MFMKKSLSKEELIEQLKRIAQTEVDIPIHLGAMCYEPAVSEAKIVKCEKCGKDIILFDCEGKDVSYLKTIVEKIKKLGYDSKIERLCSECVSKQGLGSLVEEELYEKYPYYVFYFKSNNQQEYHMAISDNENDYNAVLAFLKNEISFTDDYDATCLVKDYLDAIKKMTGISIDQE